MIISWVLIVSLYGNHSYAKPVESFDICTAEARRVAAQGKTAVCVKAFVPTGER